MRTFWSFFFLGTFVLLADDPKQKLAEAIGNLEKLPNYTATAKTETEKPPGSPAQKGWVETKFDKKAGLHQVLTFGGADLEIFIQGTLKAIKLPGEEWKTESEAVKEVVPYLQGLKSPLEELEYLIENSTSLKTDSNGAISGKLGEKGVQRILIGGIQGIRVNNPSGSIKVWIKENRIDKYETEVEATLEVEGDSESGSRKTSTEFHAFGNTKVAVPSGLAGKVGADNPEKK